jgi:hypothetical protein
LKINDESKRNKNDVLRTYRRSAAIRSRLVAREKSMNTNEQIVAQPEKRRSLINGCGTLQTRTQIERETNASWRSTKNHN